MLGNVRLCWHLQKLDGFDSNSLTSEVITFLHFVISSYLGAILAARQRLGAILSQEAKIF